MGDIPLLNLLFANKSKAKAHKEAVLLLTMRPYTAEASTGPAFGANGKTVLKDAESN
jgi:hypothetical protein